MDSFFWNLPAGDLNVTTDRRVRPYILVCTKNQAGYERLVTQPDKNLANLQKTGKMTGCPLSLLQPSPYNVGMRTRPEPATPMSRRRLAALLAAAPLAAQVSSPPTTQKTPPLGVPAPAPASATPEQRLQKAYDSVRQVSERLSKLEVPMNVEPTFTFKP